MKILLLAIGAVLLIGAAVSFAASTAPPPLTLAQQLAKSKNNNRALRTKVADRDIQIAAQNALITDQLDTIARLKDRLANQPDALDVVLARDADGKWAAMTALWRAFPNLAEGSLCGYDKSSVPGADDGLTLTIYSFQKWSGC